MTEYTDADRHRDLIDGLVGQHHRLYFTSPAFKASVTTLARMLPAMIDGLAAVAEEQDNQMKAAQAVIEKGLGLPSSKDADDRDLRYGY